MGVTLALCLKQSNHRDNHNQTIINNVNMPIQGVWNSWEHSACQSTKKVGAQLIYSGTNHNFPFYKHTGTVKSYSWFWPYPYFSQPSPGFPLHMERYCYHANRCLFPAYNTILTGVQCHCLSVVKTLHPLQHYEKYIVSSIDGAGNSRHYVCCRNTSTKNWVVLHVINSTMQNYTQLQ